ncbi:MAG: AI-2E family transporter [Nanoarchaeota archaeon]|nr:AI-2E family transporter [Nanoarchaeota archaeon]
MATNQYQRIVPFILFTLALLLLFFLVRPMITILLSSILLAYITFPLHRRIIKKIPKHKSLSIILSLFIVFIIILIPLSFLIFEVVQQGSYFYNSLSTTIVKGELFGFGCTSADSQICSIINQAERFSLERLSTFGFDRQLEKLIPLFEEKLTKFILSIPLIIAGIFLTFVISFFVIKEWKSMLERIVDLVPMRKKTINRLIKEFGTITHTVIYAQLLIALAQGLVGTIGYFIFGVPLPILLGFATAFFSLIPTVGTAIIWLPASLYLMLSGHIAQDPIILYKGIGLFFYGLLIISMIDNVILAKIVHKKAKVNQILVIIGVIGGGALFGVPGIFIGPILLPLLITYFKTFKERHDK